MRLKACSDTLDCSNLNLGQLLIDTGYVENGSDLDSGLSNAEENVVDHVVKACQLATEQCAHKVMLVLSGKTLCLTTQCLSEEEVEQELEEEWEDWVRPIIFISILIVAVAFFSFMYFGRTWLEGSVKLTYRKTQLLLKQQEAKENELPEGGPQWERLKIGLLRGTGSSSTRSSPCLSRAARVTPRASLRSLTPRTHRLGSQGRVRSKIRPLSMPSSSLNVDVPLESPKQKQTENGEPSKNPEF